MCHPDKINTLPDWSKIEYNKWADYIELSCLKNADNLFLLDDLLDHYSDERADELERGTGDHSTVFDRFIVQATNYFELIKFRSDTAKEHYPFLYDADNRTLTVKESLTDSHLFYILLLFSSNLTFFDRSTRYYLTHAFEDLSCSVLEVISPAYAVTQVFGTSRNDLDETMYRGNQRERLSALANDLCALTTKVFDSDEGFNVPGGDGGLDLVSYMPIDGHPFIPVAFGQCACSIDKWVEKQNSISYDNWRSRFCNLAPYLQYTFVPFYFCKAGGGFEYPTGILTCLFDRLRIINLSQVNEKVIEDFKNHDIYNRVSGFLDEQ